VEDMVFPVGGDSASRLYCKLDNLARKMTSGLKRR